MIRINLHKRPTAHRKKGGPRSFKWLAVTAVVLGVLCGIGGAGYGIYRFASRTKPPDKGTPTVTDSTFVATSHKSRTVVEDVVRDVQDTQLVLRETGLLDLPYADLSFEEKVNYEFLYARNVFELLSRVVPKQVGVESLVIDSFTMVKAYGICSSRETVSKMFSDFRGEGMSILPRPASSISASAGGGFRFVVSMLTEFGLNLKDPLVDASLAGLPLRSAVSDEARRLAAILKGCDLAVTQPPAMVSGTKLQKHRRLTFHVEAAGGYDDFVRSIRVLHEQKLMCAFEKLQVSATSPGRVRIKADVVFMSRE